MKSVLLRILRGFAAGALGQMAAVIAANQFNVNSLADLQTLLYILATAAIIGGILGLDKLYRTSTT